MAILNTETSRDPTLAALARNVFMESARFDINLSFILILGKDNALADLLFRWHITSQPQESSKSFFLPLVVRTPPAKLNIDWSFLYL